MDMKKDGPTKEPRTPDMDTISNFRQQMDELKKQKVKERTNLTPPQDSPSSSDESKSRTPSPFSITPELNPFK